MNTAILVKLQFLSIYNSLLSLFVTFITLGNFFLPFLHSKARKPTVPVKQRVDAKGSDIRQFEILSNIATRNIHNRDLTLAKNTFKNSELIFYKT